MMMIPATEIRRYHQPRCLSNITMMIKIRDLLTILHNAHINQDQAMMMIIMMMKKCHLKDFALFSLLLQLEWDE